MRVSAHVYLYPSMYACNYACVRVPTHMYVYLRTSTCTYECPRVPTHLYVYIRMCKCSYACESTLVFPYSFSISSISSSEMAFENRPFTVSLLFMRVTPPRVSNAHKQNSHECPWWVACRGTLCFSIWLISSSEMASEIDVSFLLCECLLRVFNAQKCN